MEGDGSPNLWSRFRFRPPSPAKNNALRGYLARKPIAMKDTKKEGRSRATLHNRQTPTK
jgi:hypothetical protein